MMKKVSKDIRIFLDCISHWEEAFLSTLREKRGNGNLYASDLFTDFYYCYSALPQNKPIY